MLSLLKKVFGSANDRQISRLAERVDRINALEPSIRRLSDSALAAKTGQFKEKLENGESLEAIVEEAFAVVREV